MVSDDAKALLKYTRDILQAHHSPNVFQVQQDIIKATTPTLRAGVESAREALQQANTRLQALVDIESGHRSNGESLSPEKRLQHDQALDKAADEQAMAMGHLVDASTRREEVLDANRGIGQDYHPIDLSTGEKRIPEQLSDQLNTHLGQRSQARIFYLCLVAPGLTLMAHPCTSYSADIAANPTYKNKSSLAPLAL